MSMAPRDPPARARDVGTVNRDFFLVALDCGTADWAMVRSDRHRRLVSLLAAIGERGNDLRDHFPGALDLHPVTGAEVFFGNQIEIVECGELDGSAADLDRLQDGVRIQGAGAADVDADAEEAGHGDVRGELSGDRPAGLPAAHDAELFLEGE
jgi:hypothetical protein